MVPSGFGAIGREALSSNYDGRHKLHTHAKTSGMMWMTHFLDETL